MIEIIIHGRGGQGVVKSAQILALAASLEGKYAQAFPNFGIERSGAPVEAYCRIDNKPILLRNQIKEADYAIVLDSSLMRIKRITTKKKLIMNSTAGKFCSSDLKNNSCSFDATSIALKNFNKPVVSTAMLAVFSCFTETIKKASLIAAIKETFPDKNTFQKNLNTIDEIYKLLKR